MLLAYCVLVWRSVSVNTCSIYQPHKSSLWYVQLVFQLSLAICADQTTAHQSFQPTQIFEEGTTEEKGENARLAAFVGAIAVGDLVKSTLGPKGMDKILQSA